MNTLQKGVHTKCAHNEGRGALCYSPDGKCVLPPPARPVARSRPPTRARRRRHILTCGEDTFVKIFEAANLNAEPRTVEHHDAAVTTLAINSKGTSLVTGTESHTASVFSYPSTEFSRLATRAQVRSHGRHRVASRRRAPS